MPLPDESIEYHYQRLVASAPENWTPLAEFQEKHLLPAERLDAFKRKLESVRGQVAAERELPNAPGRAQPLQPGFVDLPQKLLDGHRRKADQSELGRILRAANRLHANCDRLVVLGSGGGALGARALAEALGHAHHNELPRQMRMKRPRVYFDGNHFDNDTLQELLDLLETTCVEPDSVEERWGLVVISEAGESLETLAAYRAFRGKALSYYGGPKGEFFKQLVVPITGPRGKLRDLAKADGFADDEILTIPETVGGRFSVFTAAGLLISATLGMDVSALLLGAAAMTKRFLEDPFDRNPVLQFAAVNHLMAEEHGKTTRVLAVWNRKLEAVGAWYELLLSGSLGKHGRGATPLTAAYPRDLPGRGQQHQDGPRDKIVNNLIVRSAKQPPITLGMSDRNEDDLNSLSRKGYPDLLEASYRGMAEAYTELARPSADIVLPELTPFVMGQLLQMLMLATVVEGRLAGVNPYGQSGVDASRRKLLEALKATPNLPKGEVRDAAKGA